MRCHKASLCLRKPLTQGGAQGHSYARMVHKQVVEVRAIEDPEVALHYRTGGDAAGLARHQGHLAEIITRDEARQRLAPFTVLRGDLYLTRLNKVYRVAWISRRIDHLAGRSMSQQQMRGHVIQHVARQIGKNGHALEHAHRLDHIRAT